ncbi:MAG: transposase, partial [Bacteroidales bacterium]|nr:transposase [Bacteroidales bacterium]
MTLIIDLFVDSLSIKDYGFRMDYIENGRPVHTQCTRSKSARLISRNEFAKYYEANRKSYQEKERLYKRRQAIVEHPFGTIKRQWGFSYILTKKGISRASADVGFMFIA